MGVANVGGMGARERVGGRMCIFKAGERVGVTVIRR